MAFPANATNVHLDAGTDDPSQARVELSDLVDKFNALLAHFPSLAETLVGRSTAALMRTDLAVLGSKIIRKPADETVNNSTTLQNDDHLFEALLANETIYFSAFIQHIGDTNADFKLAWTIPTGASMVWSMPNARVITTDALGGGQTVSGSGVAIGCQGTTATLAQLVHGIVINGGTAGNLQLQWAQNTATVVDTRVRIHSFLTVWRA